MSRRLSCASCYGRRVMGSRLTTLLLTFLVAYPLPGGSRFAQKVAAQQPGSTDYWCPMHPNIRGAAGDVCRICHMPLVLAPAPNYMPYHLALSTSPSAPRPGESARIRLTIRHPETNAIVRTFDTVHER